MIIIMFRRNDLITGVVRSQIRFAWVSSSRVWVTMAPSQRNPNVTDRIGALNVGNGHLHCKGVYFFYNGQPVIEFKAHIKITTANDQVKLAWKLTDLLWNSKSKLHSVIEFIFELLMFSVLIHQIWIHKYHNEWNRNHSKNWSLLTMIKRAISVQWIHL